MICQRIFQGILFMGISHFFSLTSNEISLVDVVVQTPQDKDVIPLTLEHANTYDIWQWGLMKRTQLPKNHGMMFYNDTPEKISVWMFNCFMDLSSAYLDKDKVIRDISELTAYPEKMDPKRPVNTVEDIDGKYPEDDPIKLFYMERSYQTFFLASYFIEMSKNWFPDNGVKAGDVILFDENTPNASVIHTLDIGDLKPTGGKPILLTFSNARPRAIWAPNSSNNRDIAFLNADQVVVKTGSLRGGKHHNLEAKTVIYSDGPIKYILVSIPEWLKKESIQNNTKINWKTQH